MKRIIILFSVFFISNLVFGELPTIIKETEQASFCPTYQLCFHDTQTNSYAIFGYTQYYSSSGTFFIKEGYQYDFNSKRIINNATGSPETINFDYEDYRNYPPRDWLKLYKVEKVLAKDNIDRLKTDLKLYTDQLRTALKTNNREEIERLANLISTTESSLRTAKETYSILKINEKKDKAYLKDEHTKEKNALYSTIKLEDDERKTRLKNDKDSMKLAHDTEKKSIIQKYGGSFKGEKLTGFIDSKKAEITALKENDKIQRAEITNQINNKKNELVNIATQLASNQITKDEYYALYNQKKCEISSLTAQIALIKQQTASSKFTLTMQSSQLKMDKKQELYSFGMKQSNEKTVLKINQDKQKATARESKATRKTTLKIKQKDERDNLKIKIQ